MASIKRRADRGNRWEVRYRDPTGRQRARLFDRRVDAEQFLTSTEHSKLSGAYLDPALGRITLARFVDEHYRATMVGLEPSTPGAGRVIPAEPHPADVRRSAARQHRLQLLPGLGERAEHPAGRRPRGSRQHRAWAS